MAVAKNPPGSNKGRAFSRGTYEYVRNGKLVIAKWPKKRGKPKSATTRAQNEYFKRLMIALKYTDANIQFAAQKIAHGTPMYPRDVLASQMATRMWGPLQSENGWIIPMARLEDISADLDDLLGSTPGTVMFRGQQLWEGLPPPSVDSSLFYDADTDKPVWGPDQLSLRWNTATAGPVSTQDGGNTNTHGNMFRARETFWVNAIQMYIEVNSGAQYRSYIAEVNSSGVIQSILGRSDPWTATFSGNYGLQLELTEDVKLDSFKYFVAGFYMPNQNRLQPLDGYRAGSHGDIFGLPIQIGRINGLSANRVIMADNDPAPGDAFNVLSTSTAAMQIHWYPN